MMMGNTLHILMSRDNTLDRLETVNYALTALAELHVVQGGRRPPAHYLVG